MWQTWVWLFVLLFLPLGVAVYLMSNWSVDEASSVYYFILLVGLVITSFIAFVLHRVNPSWWQFEFSGKKVKPTFRTNVFMLLGQVVLLTYSAVGAINAIQWDVAPRVIEGRVERVVFNEKNEVWHFPNYPKGEAYGNGNYQLKLFSSEKGVSPRLGDSLAFEVRRGRLGLDILQKVTWTSEGKICSKNLTKGRAPVVCE